MTDRFYYPQSLDVECLRLTGAEAHHLVRVLRRQIGDRVRVFDGLGHEATAEIVAVAGGAAELRIIATSLVPEPEAWPLVLGTAIPKGDRYRWLVEKATELGVGRLVPLNTAHGVVEPGTGKQDKMRQTVIAACKQCGRNRLMPIDEPTRWDDFVRREFAGRDAYVASPDGEPISLESRRRAHAVDAKILVAVGPEGGFTAAEIQLAQQSGATLVGLGPRLLRVETAAIALAAIFGTVLRSTPSPPAASGER